MLSKVFEDSADKRVQRERAHQAKLQKEQELRSEEHATLHERVDCTEERKHTELSPRRPLSPRGIDDKNFRLAQLREGHEDTPLNRLYVEQVRLHKEHEAHFE